MKKRTMRRTRLFAFVLAVVMCVTVLPALSGKAEAAGADTYAAPNYNGVFKVYSNYINYSPYTVDGGNHDIFNFDYRKLYMECRANGGKTWLRSGYMKFDPIPLANSQSFNLFRNLKPNTKYRSRIYFGDDDGNPLSPYRYTTTFKTGKAKAPKIKSVKIKAVNIKYHKHRVGPQAYWTGYH